MEHQIFLSLQPRNNSFLSDLNKDLIETYLTVQNDTEKIIQVLRTLITLKISIITCETRNFKIQLKGLLNLFF